MYKIVNDFKEQFEITVFDYPMNIFKICEKTDNVKIRAVPFVTRNLKGAVILAKNSNENHIIMVNSNKSFEEQNFHGIHELMHVLTVDKHGTVLRGSERIKPNQDSYLEWLANEGAAEFTVPYKILLPMIKDNYSDLIQNIGTWEFCEEKAAVFGVSPIVLQNRIDSLKYEIYQYMNGVQLDKIEILSRRKQAARGIVVPSLVEMENQRLSVMWNATHNIPSSTNTFGAEFLAV